MSQNTEKKYNRAERTGVSEPENAVQPRRKRRVLAEPEDFWGRLRFRAGKKRRWFGRRCRRVIREAFRTVAPELPSGWSFVLVARVKTAFVKSGQVERELRQSLKKAGLLQSAAEKAKPAEKEKEERLPVLPQGANGGDAPV